MNGNGKDQGVPRGPNVPIIGQAPPQCTYCNQIIQGGAMIVKDPEGTDMICGACMKKALRAILMPLDEKVVIAGGKDASAK